MNIVAPEPSGFWKDVGTALIRIVDVFTKPLAVISNALSVRLAILLKRKPRLHVHFEPSSGVWRLAGDRDSRMMQIGFKAQLIHDDPKQTLILVDAFPQGTHSRFRFRDPIVVRPEELVSPEYPIWMMVAPVVGQEGTNWRCRIIFVDQFKRTYKSHDNFEFVWGGDKGVTSTASQASVA